MSSKKPIHIRISPEIIGNFAAQLALKARENQSNSIVFDWTNCEEVDSTGLTFILARLLKILNLSGNPMNWNAIKPTNPKINEILNSLGFWNLLKPTNKNYQDHDDLFPEIEKNDDRITTVLQKNKIGLETLSIPIYHLAFSSQGKERRIEVEKFQEWIYHRLIKLRREFTFHHTQLVTILTEIAKNSADHTNSDAFFGMDISTSIKRDKMVLTFAFADLGKGIKQNIQSYYSEVPKKRIDHFSIYEAYYFALQPGFTTKPQKSINKGVGMSLIIEGSKGMNLALSVFDARSRGLLHQLKGRTHLEIRPIFFDLDTNVGFCYFGKLNAEKS